MESFLPVEDKELKSAFGIILSIESFSKHINEIVELIFYDEFNRENLGRVLQTHEIRRIEDIKEELLDLLLVYIGIVLNDNAISEHEAGNVRILKRAFRIVEGDFYNYRYEEVVEVLLRQFNQIYFDGYVDDGEALHKVSLQELFDLSYDQFTKIANIEAKAALERGAGLDNLDTVIKLPEVVKAVSAYVGRDISKAVQTYVWHRDNGSCTQCGTTNRLKYNTIIPF